MSATSVPGASLTGGVVALFAAAAAFGWSLLQKLLIGRVSAGASMTVIL